MGVSTFSQENGIVPLCAGATSITSNAEMDSVNMSGYDQLTIIFLFAASLVGNGVLTLECGATDGADTSDATFHYRLGSAAPGSATSDTYAADATSAELSLTAATYQGKALIVELHADELPRSGETVYNYVTADFDGTNSTGSVTAFAILSKPRYAQAVMPSAIPAA